MFWYRLTDFFKSRLGHVVLFCLAVVGLVVMAGKYFKKREGQQQLVATQFPRLPDDGGWSKDDSVPANPNPNEEQVFQHETAHKDFVPFRPPALLSVAPPIVQVEPEPVVIPEEPEEFVPLAPLIQFQGRSESHEEKATVVRRPTNPEREFNPPQPPEPPSLDLEAGAVLYAELTGPISSEPGSVVSARLTRALKRGGKIIAPKGARLIGSVERGAQNRLFLSDQWRIEKSDRSQVSFHAQTQESSIDPQTNKYTLNDGRVGLPGLKQSVGQRLNPLWAKTLNTLAVVAGRLAQDRVRTAVGDFVPGTARNVILEGSSRMIEEHGIPFLTPRPPAKLVLVEAGRSFYLSILP